MRQKIAIIGGGFGGLAAACLLGKAGYDVTVYEKNEQLGGRAGLLEAEGFRFDTGPSWYLMPGVFRHFFELLDERTEDYFTLTRLSPSFRVFDEATQRRLDITSDPAQDAAMFETLETGAGQHLKDYLSRVDTIAKVVESRFLHTNFDNKRELITPQLLRPQLAASMHQDAARFFTHSLLQKIVEYPAIFLGTSPYRAPALYGMLNHYLLAEGVFYPSGGMYSLVRALVKIGEKHGVVYKTNAAVTQIAVEHGRTTGVFAQNERHAADIVISDAGKYHTETALLTKDSRDHPPSYWQRRKWSPSALLLHLGLDRRYDSLAHHNLLFAKDWRKNITQIFDHPGFPENPSLYVCAPSRTDKTTAPPGSETLFVLVPVRSGFDYNQAALQKFTQKILEKLENTLQLPELRRHIVYQKTFSGDTFTSRFNSYGGNGLGLQHTLRQSALLRPGNTSGKVKNLYYVGADVHPGVGLPPVLVSAELAYNRIVGIPS